MFALASLLFATNVFLMVSPVSASTLTTSYIRLNRIGTSNSTSIRVQFKAISAGATSLTVNFNGADTTTWTGQGGSVNAAQTTDTVACASETGDTALPGSLTSSGSGSTITTTGITALSAGSTYCIDYTSASAVTTPSAAGEFHPIITAGSDSNAVGIRIISGNTADQVTVNGTVPPTFNFVIGGCASNTDNFTSNLNPSSVVSTGGCNVTVNTNAHSGWHAWVKDSNTGLNSTTAVKTIASVPTGSTTTLVANGANEKYGVGVTSVTQGTGAGVVTANPAYDATASGGANAVVGGIDNTLRPIASSTGTAASAVISIKERAVIAGATPAASDYTDTITVIGAGNF